MRKLRTGDEVIVTTGKSKGARGKILRVAADGLRVVVEGANLIKKHVKPNPNTNTKGGIVEKEAALSISNVAIFNSVTQRADKIGIKILEDGRKVRYFKSNGEMIEVQ